MHQKSFIWIFVLVVVVAPILVFTGVKWYENRYSGLPVLGGPDHTVAAFNAVNAESRAVTLDDWNDKIVVVDFFFTRCPTICPKMTRNMQTVLQAFAGNNDLSFNSFSIDPVRDSAATLSAFAKKNKIEQANWNLLTGDKKHIYWLARKSFMVTATDGDGEDGDFIHSDLFVLVDRQKRIRGYYSGTDDKAMQQLIRDIKKLMNE